MAHHKISRPVHDLETLKAARIADTARKTLGALVGELLGSVVTNQTDTPDEETTSFPEDVNSVSMSIHKGLTDADFAQTENELKELVLLRNNLVHHFIDQHDLWSLDGCRGAHDALVADFNRIDQHYERLRRWAEGLERTKRMMADLIRSDVFHELVVNGIAPDGTVDWPTAGIVSALREAARELGVDGWTSVAEASRWIAERYPEQLPSKYGCSSWWQVVHEAQSFQLLRVEADGQRFAWYREKESSVNTC